MIRKEFDFEEIEVIFRLLYNILFPKGYGGLKFEIEEFEFDESLLDLKSELKNLIDKKNFCHAEVLLLNRIESDQSREALQLAVWFYFKINEFNDEVLEKSGFSRYQISEGLKVIEGLVMRF